MTEFWLSNLENKIRIPKSQIRISNLFFYLLILFIPTQFGLHFWPDFSFVKGARVDYLSPTLYATDVLIILIFILSVAKFSHNAFASRGKQISILIFLVSLVVGVFMSKSPQAGIYGLTKLLEFAFLGFYIAHNIKKLKFENILLMFSIGIIFESFLAISQYFNHGSLQGVFYFFGERFFNSNTAGIANATLGGELILRPYGTFPHPNVLAGYLVIAMTFLIFNFKFLIKSKFSILNFKTFLFIISLILGMAGLFLTLSRVAILLWLIVIGSWFIINIKNRKVNLKKSIGLLAVLVCIGSIIFITPFGTRFTELRLTDESIVQRESLIQSSIAMISDHPIFGVGLNNFLINLPSYQKPMSPLFSLQPVHNIFLLILSETGIVGFSFFIWFIFKTFKKIGNQPLIRNSLFIILSTILTLGMLDHYFLTLQQGQLLLVFVVGLCWSDPETSSE